MHLVLISTSHREHYSINKINCNTIFMQIVIFLRKYEPLHILSGFKAHNRFACDSLKASCIAAIRYGYYTPHRVRLVHTA